MSLTFLNTAMIEQPASINQLSAYNLQSVIHTGDSILANSLSAKSLTADNIYLGIVSGVQSISGDLVVGGSVIVPSGNSTQWNQTYSLVQANSATWEESDEILPTVTNYLSTSNVLVDSLNTLNTIFSAGVVLDDIFVKNESLNALSGNWENTYTSVNLISGRYENVSTVVESTSSTWNNTTTTVSEISFNTVNVNTVVNESSANWNNTYTDFNELSSSFYNATTVVQNTSASWIETTSIVSNISGLTLNNTTILTESSANWDSVYTQFNNVSGTYEITQTVLEETSGLWNTGYDLAGKVTTIMLESSANWNNTYAEFSLLSSSLTNTDTVLSEASASWDLAYNISTVLSEVSSNWDSAYNISTVITEVSSNWESTYTSYNENSARFDEVYTTVADNSSTWIEAGDSLVTVLDYLSTNNVVINSLEGVDSNLIINGNVTFTGEISTLSAIQITDTLYLTGYTTLLSTLSVEGDIETSLGRILSASINISDIFVHQVDFDSVSLNWNDNYSTVNSLSSNWTDTYLSYSPISGTLTNLATNIQSTSSNQVYIEANNSGSALRVKQIGSGDVVVIEDTTGTDSTPLVINTNGDMIVGHTGTLITSNYIRSSITPKIEVVGTSNSSSTIGLYSYTTSSNQPPTVIFNRSRGSAVGISGSVSQGDILGGISWTGDDGNSFETAASILGIADQTPTADNVPGGISFNTLSPLSSVLAERVYIDSDGRVFVRTEVPVSITNFSTNIGNVDNFTIDTILNVYGGAFIAGNITLSSGYNSQDWSNVYHTVNTLSATEWSNVYNTVNGLSSTWGATPDPLPTTINYLSTELVFISSVNIMNQLLSGGVDLHDIFITSAEETQTLYYDESGTLSISGGNSITLSAFDTISTTSNILSAGTNLSDIFLTPSNTLTTSICAVSGDGATPFVMQFTNGLLTGLTY